MGMIPFPINQRPTPPSSLSLHIRIFYILKLRTLIVGVNTYKVGEKLGCRQVLDYRMDRWKWIEIETEMIEMKGTVPYSDFSAFPFMFLVPTSSVPRNASTHMSSSLLSINPLPLFFPFFLFTTILRSYYSLQIQTFPLFFLFPCLSGHLG